MTEQAKNTWKDRAAMAGVVAVFLAALQFVGSGFGDKRAIEENLKEAQKRLDTHDSRLSRHDAALECLGEMRSDIGAIKQGLQELKGDLKDHTRNHKQTEK